MQIPVNLLLNIFAANNYKMKSIKFEIVGLVIFLMMVITFSNCKKDNVTTNPSAKLNFSADTVTFDTVFTTVGSSTQWLMVYNKNNQKINISSISLAKGASSYFRLNINGGSSRSLNNVTIEANDSMFIFVEVTVNPTLATTPFIITDSILFVTNGNKQYVELVAFGQNAHFIYAAPGSIFDSAVPCSTEWKNDKPYVIYGYLPVICNLTIDSGCRIYFHANSGIVVFSGATLTVNGALGHEVTFQGDRLELDYAQVPGQWDEILFSNLDPHTLTLPNKPGSKSNVINYAIIKNGSIGIEADTVYTSTDITLTINNTIIENMSTAGIVGKGTNIRGYNDVFVNCANECGAFTLGGGYSFRQCTFANYWGYGVSQRTAPALLLNNYYRTPDSVYHIRPLDSAYFGNCIVYGNIADEVGLDFHTNAYSYYFDHDLLNSSLTYSGTNSNALILKQDPLFVNNTNLINNYKLNSGSPAIGTGASYILTRGTIISSDITGATPLNNPPDLGAYKH